MAASYVWKSWLDKLFVTKQLAHRHQRTVLSVGLVGGPLSVCVAIAAYDVEETGGGLACPRTLSGKTVLSPKTAGNGCFLM